MKVSKIIIILTLLIGSMLTYFVFFKEEEIEYNVTEEVVESFKELEPLADLEPIVYEGMTMNELADKLNKVLTSNLEGTGMIFARKSIELGVDPYLAVSIVLHETGCIWGCSGLVRDCNNVGGMKGRPGCYGGSYASFDSLEIGITKFLENLAYNYYAYGLTTPETINPKYAESKAWAERINYYIDYIRKI